MTHIHPTNEVDPSFTVSTTKVSKNKDTDAFENALSKALDNREAPEMKTTPANSLGEIESTSLQLLQPSDIVAGRTDRLLKMLDAYASKLKDPEISLKSLAPVLEEIQKNAGSLEREIRDLTRKDAGLKTIADQTLVTVQTEVLKFQRGDYLS
jgi:hypothetical protein